ncbi:MAG: gamma-glutamyl-gamma-aminobutyrate hydrolase family protein, partial [Myxococcota bacterium]|nr:gamma-glutamyl-gamma-aminobutyrate hydrolase family protein [Myxococcota bacterium]
MSVIVAITTDRRELSPKVHSPRVRPSRPEVFLKEKLVERIVAAGGMPILLPPLTQGANIDSYCRWVCQNASAVVISGGAFDIDPRHYGEDVQGRIDRIDENRTGLELALALHCVERKTPLLGICGGMQALAVALGGRLIQDIATEIPNSLEHEQPTDPAQPWHPVSFASSRFQRWYQSDHIDVNSTHHQA